MEVPKMLKIGEFSKLSRVSVRMLRHYDEIGLLRPAEIDRFTDYRYYREDQLPTVCRITALRDMGFSLADVTKILEIYDDRAKIESFFNVRQKELEEALKDAHRKLMLLDTARERLRKDNIMDYNVTVRTIPERYAATVRTVIPQYDQEGRVWGILCGETAGMSITPADPCLCGVTFLDGEYKEHDVEIEAWKTVRGKYPDTEHVKFRMLPEVTAASCVFKGGYELISEVYSAVISWINGNGYKFDGPMFNIYHVSPAETSDPREYVTEVCFPISR